MMREAEILSNSVYMDGEREMVPVNVQLFVTWLDAVTSLPWQARGNWLHAHTCSLSPMMSATLFHSEIVVICTNIAYLSW